MSRDKHDCSVIAPEGNLGSAITVCYELDGSDELWVCNDEYSSRVSYCPFCGYRSKKPMELVLHPEFGLIEKEFSKRYEFQTKPA